MLGLWGDMWFYISGAGFLVSLALFGFLLGQYRAAVQAADQGAIEALAPMAAPVKLVEVAPAPKPALVQNVSKPSSEKTLLLPPEPKPAPAPAPVPAPVAAAPTAAPAVRKENTTGALSPAVIYLQNIKIQMDGLDKEVASLKAALSKQGAQNEAILNQILELGSKMKAVAASPASAPAAAAEPLAAPEPVRMPAVEPPPAPAPVDLGFLAPTSEPPPEAPAPSPAVELTSSQPSESAPGPSMPTLELKPAPESAAASPQPEAAPQDKPARKGPVWPI